MASPVSPLTGSSSAANSTAGSLGMGAPPSEEMFLNLLVAQLKNQDPLNPTDSTQFVTQLAQFSELEQVIGIRSDLESQIGAASASSPSSGTPVTPTAPPTPAPVPTTGGFAVPSTRTQL